MRILLLGMVSLALADAESAVRLPSFSRQVLPNGIVLMLAPKPDVPMMTVQLTIRGGSESDPADMSGVASLTAELLRSGTNKRTAEQISQQFDALGATLITAVTRQAAVVRTEFLKTMTFFN